MTKHARLRENLKTIKRIRKIIKEQRKNKPTNQCTAEGIFQNMGSPRTWDEASSAYPDWYKVNHKDMTSPIQTPEQFVSMIEKDPPDGPPTPQGIWPYIVGGVILLGIGYSLGCYNCGGCG